MNDLILYSQILKLKKGGGGGGKKVLWSGKCTVSDNHKTLTIPLLEEPQTTAEIVVAFGFTYPGASSSVSISTGRFVLSLVSDGTAVTDGCFYNSNSGSPQIANASGSGVAPSVAYTSGTGYVFSFPIGAAYTFMSTDSTKTYYGVVYEAGSGS